jgi:hypothetical protein
MIFYATTQLLFSIVQISDPNKSLMFLEYQCIGFHNLTGVIPIFNFVSVCVYVDSEVHWHLLLLAPV